MSKLSETDHRLRVSEIPAFREKNEVKQARQNAALGATVCSRASLLFLYKL